MRRQRANRGSPVSSPALQAWACTRHPADRNVQSMKSVRWHCRRRCRCRHAPLHLLPHLPLSRRMSASDCDVAYCQHQLAVLPPRTIIVSKSRKAPKNQDSNQPASQQQNSQYNRRIPSKRSCAGSAVPSDGPAGRLVGQSADSLINSRGNNALDRRRRCRPSTAAAGVYMLPTTGLLCWFGLPDLISTSTHSHRISSHLIPEDIVLCRCRIAMSFCVSCCAADGYGYDRSDAVYVDTTTRARKKSCCVCRYKNA